ncbi:unnamed protein product [Discosporangium mesarthrocarpum]
MYETWIFAPVGDDLKKVTDTFGKLRFPGAVGSTDVTHIRCAPASHATYYRGKEGCPSTAYQVTVDHSGHALAVTEGFAGAKNDKVIIHFDRFCDRVKYYERFTSMEYTLLYSRGVMGGVGGGRVVGECVLHDLFCEGVCSLLCPFKASSTKVQLKWSNWLESVRKDVECYFGRRKVGSGS